MRDARVHLLFEISDVIYEVVALEVPFGIAGAHDVESAVPCKECGEVGGVRKVRTLRKVGTPVAAQGEHVFDTALGEVVQNAANPRRVVAHAGQMREGLHAEALDLFGEFCGQIAAARAARAVGDADIVRFERGELGELVRDCLRRRICLGREDFKGEYAFFSVEKISDVHDSLQGGYNPNKNACLQGRLSEILYHKSVF